MAKFLKKKKLNRSFGGNLALFSLLTLGGIFMGLPLVYTVVSAFKPIEELFYFPPRFFVINPTLENFIMMFELTSNLWVPFSRYVFNSVIVTLVGTGGYVIIASMAAYPIAKHNFYGKKLLRKLIVLALLFTPEVTNIPRYIVISELGLINTLYSVILPVFAGTMGVFLMERFMTQFPDITLEAAKIDGASEYRIYWNIVMPNQKPAYLTLMIFTFTTTWNNTGGIYIFDENIKLLPTILRQMSTGGISRAGVASAVGLILMIPPIITFILTQSQVLETMSHSGIKG